MNKDNLSVEEIVSHIWTKSPYQSMKLFPFLKNMSTQKKFRDIEKENNYRWEITEQWKENRGYKGEKKDTNKQ